MNGLDSAFGIGFDAEMNRLFFTLGAWFVFVVASFAQSSPALPTGVQSKIDQEVRDIISASGAPSASIAIVKDGRIAYVQAYGQARRDKHLIANPQMRYAIGSISKQFTAAAILMLLEEGKLSLDDPVGRFIPELTEANKVTVRQVLSHTSGYQDFWPQDYVPPYMLKSVSPDEILQRWARKKLDFEPGTKWQYSNTGYTVAGIIFERASGQSVFDFLKKRVFAPLGMKSVFNFDENPMTENDPLPYLRNGLGPLRIAPTSGKGWLFAAGELAMTAEDLAKWDISLIEQTLLKPASYREMESATILKTGLASDYALGVHVKEVNSHRCISHGGEVSGFTANNMVFPDERVAVVALVNQDATSASGDMARRIAKLILPPEDASGAEKRARGIFEGLQHGKIDRTLFSENGNTYFNAETLKDHATGLMPLGKLESLRQTTHYDRGGMTCRTFEIKFQRKKVEVTEFVLPDGKIEQFQVTGVE